MSPLLGSGGSTWYDNSGICLFSSLCVILHNLSLDSWHFLSLKIHNPLALKLLILDDSFSVQAVISEDAG